MTLKATYYIVISIIAVLEISAQERSVTVGPATINEGGSATMTCVYTLAPSDDTSLLSLSWANSDENGMKVGSSNIVSTSGNSNNGRFSISSENNRDLIISNVEVADAGYYQCKIVTQNADAKDNYAALIVNYLDAPDLTPTETYFKENEKATFTCPEPNGVPTPIINTWFKDSHVLDVSDIEKYLQSDTTLEIRKLNEMDAGQYQCRAENTAYSGEEGKLSNKGSLKFGSDDNDNDDVESKAGLIAGIVIAVILVIACAGLIGYSYVAKKLCFSENGNKNSEGNSEIVNLTDANSPTYAQVENPKPANKAKTDISDKAPPKPKRADSGKMNPEKPKANVEQLTYAELDLTKNTNDGNQDRIIRTDPETEYSSVRPSKK